MSRMRSRTEVSQFLELSYLLLSNDIVLPMRQSFFSIFSAAANFCLAYALTHLTRDVKIDVTTLNFRSDVTSALPLKALDDVRRRPLWM